MTNRSQRPLALHPERPLACVGRFILCKLDGLDALEASSEVMQEDGCQNYDRKAACHLGIFSLNLRTTVGFHRSTPVASPFVDLQCFTWAIRALSIRG